MEQWLDTRTFVVSCASRTRPPSRCSASSAVVGSSTSPRAARGLVRLPSVLAGAGRRSRRRVIVDNFYVRSLLGATFAETPPERGGTCGAGHRGPSTGPLLILENLDRGFDQPHRLGWCRPNNAELRQSFGPGDETIHFSRRIGESWRAQRTTTALQPRGRRGAEKNLPPADVGRPCRACRAKPARAGGGYARTSLGRAPAASSWSSPVGVQVPARDAAPAQAPRSSA